MCQVSSSTVTVAAALTRSCGSAFRMSGLEHTARQFGRPRMGERPTLEHLQRQMHVRVTDDGLRQLDS